MAVTLTGSGATTTSTGVTVSGSTVTVTAAGTYRFTGSLTNGQIVVNSTGTGDRPAHPERRSPSPTARRPRST